MDILKLDTPLKTTAAAVQVTPELPAGTYEVELQIVDAAGQRASASLSFRIVGRIVPPITPITPVTPFRPTRPTG